VEENIARLRKLEKLTRMLKKDVRNVNEVEKAMIDSIDVGDFKSYNKAQLIREIMKLDPKLSMASLESYYTEEGLR